ncbi:hypothetical protein PPERSA_00072 [Pseudocohnilembus persalinus]|uniref:Uncharacterized protein n=1 Tax=Pseudocohnilembus persalinus TaxID=266149 RepID=A0A0V0QYL7_PSEPJ|nr:hypothetical protein PPERSA_00072 [Pseudocohnilembus persalinus]|eukprot:KRX07162.1 hypothetical protein PPERSA_00072 [Pseudocohnilembus persalinus]
MSKKNVIKNFMNGFIRYIQEKQNEVEILVNKFQQSKFEKNVSLQKNDFQSKTYRNETSQKKDEIFSWKKFNRKINRKKKNMSSLTEFQKFFFDIIINQNLSIKSQFFIQQQQKQEEVKIQNVQSQEQSLNITKYNILGDKIQSPFKNLDENNKLNKYNDTIQIVNNYNHRQFAQSFQIEMQCHQHSQFSNFKKNLNVKNQKKNSIQIKEEYENHDNGIQNSQQISKLDINIKLQQNKQQNLNNDCQYIGNDLPYQNYINQTKQQSLNSTTQNQNNLGSLGNTKQNFLQVKAVCIKNKKNLLYPEHCSNHQKNPQLSSEVTSKKYCNFRILNKQQSKKQTQYIIQINNLEQQNLDNIENQICSVQQKNQINNDNISDQNPRQNRNEQSDIKITKNQQQISNISVKQLDKESQQITAKISTQVILSTGNIQQRELNEDNKSYAQYHYSDYEGQILEKKILRIFALKFLRNEFYSYIINKSRVKNFKQQFQQRSYIFQKLLEG